MLQVAHAVRDGMKLGEGKLGLVDDGIIGVKDGILLKMTDFDGLINRGSASVRDQLAKQRLEQRRLSRAVIADQTDALAAVDVEIELVEEDALAEGFLDVGEGSDGHRTDV